MTLPVATLDHVGVNARDDLDAAAETYRRLGFTLTPRGKHTLGTVNHLAVFGTDYLELIAAPPGRDDLAPMRWPAGLNAVVFGTEDAEATHAALVEAGVAVQPPLAFSRPVAGGEASFRTVNLEAFPGGRGYFCQHLTRKLVWQDEVRRHPNGVVGVDGVMLAARDWRAVAALWMRVFGVDSVEMPQHLDSATLACGLTRMQVTTPERVQEELGDAAPAGDGRDVRMVALRLRTASMTRTMAALREIPDAEFRRGWATGLVIPAKSAFGVALAFVA